MERTRPNKKRRFRRLEDKLVQVNLYYYKNGSCRVNCQFLAVHPRPVFFLVDSWRGESGDPTVIFFLDVRCCFCLFSSLREQALMLLASKLLLLSPHFFPTMQHPHKRLRLSWSVSLYYIFFSTQVLHADQSVMALTLLPNETDRSALLSFKSQITSDPFQVLSSWNDTLHFCDWEGVTCSGRAQRITVLDLSSRRLTGTLSPHIANLTCLIAINLDDNHLYGNIPQSVGGLSRLQNLSLAQNSLVGEIPTNLSFCLELRAITLTYNKLVGCIPSSLSALPKLTLLRLSANNLSGTLPPSLVNLSSLIALSVARNNLDGSIPMDLGRIPSLSFLQLSSNKLSGTIPSSIFNLSAMWMFSVASNQLTGSIPASLGFNFPKLQQLYMGTNQFTGGIPLSLPNASALREAYFTYNDLTGPVSMSFGSLNNLQILSFGNNQLGSNETNDLDFVQSLTNCTKLKILQLSSNLFTGQMPRSIVNLSTQLEHLTLGDNHLWGAIPAGIENLANLTVLTMDQCLLTGIIPPAIGKLNKLKTMMLSRNRLSGAIPSSVGNWTELIELYLDENRLQGNIPSTLGNCRSLLVLNISHNNITGTIPQQLLNLPSLSKSLSLAHNQLIGSFPSEVGALVNLRELDVSVNKLSGGIPTTIGSCIALELLRLEGNNFEGTIPQTLSELKGLQKLDLSQNNLSGHIPAFLENLSGLQLLNLSLNNLEGEVPKKGIFSNASAVSLLGNKKLCGGILQLQLPACTDASHKRQPHIVAILVPFVVVSVLGLIFCIITVACIRKRWSKHHPSSSSSLEKSNHPKISHSQMIRANLEDRYLTVSYSDLFEATNGFSPDNLIGAGSYGSVYKGVLESDEAVVAVKVLNLQQEGAFRSFARECETLKGIRHRNLVRILTACSSVDRQGKEFRALVLEFMANGSLEEWLHRPAESMQKNLNLDQRLNVAIDVAAALDYLHSQCQTPIVHCDLKPNNILIDDNMCAHLGDFGLARLLLDLTATSSRSKTISMTLKGSIGYVAPEYGMGANISTQGDVYSYGILLLEMLTGKRPTDELFTQGLTLHGFAKMALPHRLIEVVDPNLLSVEEEEDVFNNIDSSGVVEMLTSMMKLGLICSEISPKVRPGMKDVFMELHAIRDFVVTKRMDGSKQLKIRSTEL